MSVAAKKRVELFYDVLSPYAWIGFEILCRYQQRWNLHVKLTPVFFGGILRNSDNVGPATNARKLSYMRKDIMRLAPHYGIPFSAEYVRNFEPKTMPFFYGANISAQRLLVVADSLHPDRTKVLSSELFKRHWNTNRDLLKPESLAEAARDVGFSDSEAENLVSKIKEPATKKLLLDTTQALTDLGGFGVPTMHTHDKDGQSHVLFGSDRFHILADILGEKYEGPLKELSTFK